ncbi:MAG: PEGA domain-containing protein [Myxococcota bacterium]
MNIRIATALIIACAGLALAPAPVRAQDSDLERAKEHFDKAQALVSAGQFEKAAEEFGNAYEARDLPEFLYNIGVCYEKLAKEQPTEVEAWSQAIDYYNKYLKAKPKATDRKAINKRIKVLKEERKRIMARLEKSASTDVKTSAKVDALDELGIRGLVVIESDPSDAVIYLDSKQKGPLSKTPWSGTIEGEHKVFIERRGYKPVEKTISPSPDKLLVLSFSLAEEDYLGWIDIKANVPGANIYIDDKSVGVYSKTPFSGNLKPGKHKIWITADGYDEYFEEIDILQGQTHTVEAKLKGSPVGYLNVRGEGIENTTVYMDGQVLCERGPCRKAVKQGKHKVEVKRKGHKTFERTIDMQPKTEVIMRVNMAKKPGRGDAIWAYVFTAAFAGGATFVGLQAKNVHDELEEEIERGLPPPDPDDPRFQRGKIYTWIAVGGYAISGVTLLTAVYYTLRDKGPPSRGTIDVRAVAVQPQIGPDYAGLGMEVSW